MRILVAAAAALMLAGCTTAPDGTPVQLLTDNYCSVAKKIRWHSTDTAETIDQARRENAKIDRLCGPKSASPPKVAAISP